MLQTKLCKCNCQPVASVYIEISDNNLGETRASVGVVILVSMKALYTDFI